MLLVIHCVSAHVYHDESDVVQVIKPLLNQAKPSHHYVHLSGMQSVTQRGWRTDVCEVERVEP